MKIEVYDFKNKIQLYTGDIIFGLDNIIIKDCQNITEHQLYDFLMNRARLPNNYEIDKKVLSKLNLLDKQFLFGRMNEANILYAILTNFKSDIDEIQVFPIKDEIISMINYDPRYSNIYIWRKRIQFNFL